MAGLLVRRMVLAVVVCSGLVLAGLPAPGAQALALAGSGGCPAPAPGEATCAVAIAPGTSAVSGAAMAASAAAPPGYSPSDLQSAYGLAPYSAVGGTGQTVAVVTAYDDASAETDMGTYRSQYGLPACTTADGCFSKVNETGGDTYPPEGVAGWTLATAAAVDMISAVCPNCHIDLVEATTTAISDLGTAENEAVSLGAKFVANTWFNEEQFYGSNEPMYDSEYFDHPGVVMTDPDGNGGGYGTYYPAASPDVIAVGGTILTQDSATPRGWAETASAQTGSGCSGYEAKPAWQTDTGCAGRTLNDVSAVGDTSTPVALFDTLNGGWVETGENGVAAAIIAAAYALGGAPAAGTSPAAYLYANPGLFNDITTGSNGTCTPAYLCTAGPGYDGPTGLGTPNGAPGFEHLLVNAFEMGAKGQLYQSYDQASGAFTGWTAVAGSFPGGTLQGSISAAPAPFDNDSINEFAMGSNGHLYQSYQTSGGQFTDWGAISDSFPGGTLQGSISAMPDPADGDAFNLFAMGSNGHLYQSYEGSSGQFTGWAAVADSFPGGTLRGSISALWAPASGNDPNVFAMGSNGHLYQSYEGSSGQFTGWGAVADSFPGGTPQGSIWAGPAPFDDNLINLFAVGSNGQLYQSYETSTGSFTGWTAIAGSFPGGTLQGSISALPDPSDGNTFNLFAMGSNGHLYQSYETTGGQFTDWAAVAGSFPGGSLEGSISALWAPDSFDDINVLAMGSNGHMYQSYQALNGQFTDWAAVADSFPGSPPQGSMSTTPSPYDATLSSGW